MYLPIYAKELSNTGVLTYICCKDDLMIINPYFSEANKTKQAIKDTINLQLYCLHTYVNVCTYYNSCLPY
jgi:hypothetical protein